MRHKESPVNSLGEASVHTAICREIDQYRDLEDNLVASLRIEESFDSDSEDETNSNRRKIY